MVSLKDQLQFNEISIPSKLEEHSYTILDTSDGSVFINVNHDKTAQHLGTVYVSDSTGFRFQKSLENNIRSDDGQCDFERVPIF